MIIGGIVLLILEPFNWVMTTRLDPKVWRDRAVQARAISRRLEDAAMRNRLEEIADRYDTIAEITSRAVVPAASEKRRAATLPGSGLNGAAFDAGENAPPLGWGSHR
jgi:hypothetical protein